MNSLERSIRDAIVRFEPRILPIAVGTRVRFSLPADALANGTRPLPLLSRNSCAADSKMVSCERSFCSTLAFMAYQSNMIAILSDHQ